MPRFFSPQSEPEPVPENQPPAHPEDELSPKLSEAGEVKTLFSWIAAARPFRKKDRSYYTTIAIIVVLLVLIALLIKEFLLIGALLSLAFVAYVLAFVPPNDVTYKISTQGVTIEDHFWFWHELDSFWFKEKEGHRVLYIQTKVRFPGQLMLVLGPSTSSGQGDEEEVKKEVAKFLPFQELPKMSLIDKWAEGLQKHFPLENTHR